MSRAQQIALLVVAGAAVVAAGAALALLASRTGDTQSSPPLAAATDDSETVVVTATAPSQTVTTQAKTSAVEATGDIAVQIDDVSSKTVETYGTCEKPVEVLIAVAEDYAGSVTSYPELVKAAQAAEKPCTQAATDIAGQAGEAAAAASTKLQLAIAQYARLAQAQAGGASQMTQALETTSKGAASTLAAAYVTFAASLDGQAKAATKALEQARTQAGLSPQPSS